MCQHHKKQKIIVEFKLNSISKVYKIHSFLATLLYYYVSLDLIYRIMFLNKVANSSLEKKMVARCYGASDLRDAISNISYRVIRSLYRGAGCKLSSDVGGLTYFLISFTSSRARRGRGGTANEEIFSLPLFYRQALHRYSLAGISTGSSRTINKRTSSPKSGRIAYRCYSPTFRLVSFSGTNAHAPIYTRQFLEFCVCARTFRNKC